MTLAMLLMALGMGFFGSPHCLGMCGGIVTAFGLSMQNLTQSKKTMLMLTYHFGRLCSYAFLGLVAGLIGTTVLQPILVNNNLPRVLIGAVLIVVGLSMLGLPFLNHLEKMGGQLWQKMSPIRQKVFPIDSFGKALMAGLLWGFLPCGLVYGALLMAVVGHDTVSGAVLMFVFGLGTLPMLIATQTTVLALQQRIKRFRLRQANGVIMVLSGFAVIFLPMAMHAMHGHDHSMHTSAQHAQMSHENHADMNHSQMNHDGMNHDSMSHSHSHEQHRPTASAPQHTGHHH